MRNSIRWACSTEALRSVIAFWMATAHDAAKLGENAVAGRVDDAPTELADHRLRLRTDDGLSAASDGSKLYPTTTTAQRAPNNNEHPGGAPWVVG